jgi:hypothetical protein
MRLKKPLQWIVAALLVALAGIQFVPVDRSNPPIRSELSVASDAAATLRASCFDCHSNETRWPWYSRIAPVSWLVAYDVHEGREHLNFSEWASLAAKEQQKAMEEIAEEVEEGKMPLWFYVLMHRDAALSARERELLLRWADSGAETEGQSRDHR